MPQGEFWLTDGVRVLTDPAPVGKGTKALTVIGLYTDNDGNTNQWSRLKMRTYVDGVTVPANIGFDWDETPASRTKAITHRAWDDFKDMIDDLRTAEAASAFNWTETINGAGEAIGPLGYRNECAAAFEQWCIPIGRFDTLYWFKDSGRVTGWTNAVDTMCTDSPTSSNPASNAFVALYFRGNGYPAPYTGDFESQLTRIYMTVNVDSDDLPTTVDRYVFRFVIGHNQTFNPVLDYWSRDFEVELWSADGTDYDDLDTKITSWDKATDFDSPDSPYYLEANWQHFYVDVTSYITASSGGTNNHFCLKLDKDDTTETGGDYSEGSAPGIASSAREGVYIRLGAQSIWQGENRTFGTCLIATVDDVADI